MTEALSENTAALQRRIANWLGHTRNVNIAIDGDLERAARKARELRQAILEGRLEPESLIIDEDLKEVEYLNQNAIASALFFSPLDR